MQAKDSIKAIAQRVERRKFRFRNVMSLVDYLATEDECGGFVMSVNLDTGRWSQINAEQKRYALLSSDDEVDFLNSRKDVIQVVLSNYAKATEH